VYLLVRDLSQQISGSSIGRKISRDIKFPWSVPLDLNRAGTFMCGLKRDVCSFIEVRKYEDIVFGNTYKYEG
jgi:hypothetical protein